MRETAFIDGICYRLKEGRGKPKYAISSDTVKRYKRENDTVTIYYDVLDEIDSIPVTETFSLIDFALDYADKVGITKKSDHLVFDFSGSSFINLRNMWRAFSCVNRYVDFIFPPKNKLPKHLVDASYMFFGLDIRSIDLTDWNTTYLKDVSYMFAQCDMLSDVKINLNCKFNINTSRMFSGCESLVNLDLPGIDLSRVNDASSMFEDCTNLEHVSFKTTSGTNEHTINAKNMFCMNLKLSEFDFSYFGNSEIDVSDMFFGVQGPIDVKGAKNVELLNSQKMFSVGVKIVDPDIAEFMRIFKMDRNAISDGLGNFFVASGADVAINEYNLQGVRENREKYVLDLIVYRTEYVCVLGTILTYKGKVVKKLSTIVDYLLRMYAVDLRLAVVDDSIECDVMQDCKVDLDLTGLSGEQAYDELRFVISKAKIFDSKTVIIVRR